MAYRKFSDVTAKGYPLPIVGQNRQPILKGRFTVVAHGWLWHGTNGFFAPIADFSRLRQSPPKPTFVTDFSIIGGADGLQTRGGSNDFF